ncbi:hypothetical protein AURDEDRAFT_157377 [Auricularia subglabra TFB-10046 SS5]|nr:hypothetical protein AURDEDRAFT_157377 [Auricularia subglabra TFB-10046 SS5]
MGKLRFKETDLEREERTWRKEERAKRKRHERAERYADDDEHDGRSSRKHRRRDSPLPEKSSTEKGLEEEAYRRLLREEEDKAFRAKLFDEMGFEDEADNVHAMMGDYFVPDRWASSVHAAPANPDHMTDDEYAEWVRESMWKRTHAKEAEDAEKRQKDRDERRARDKARRRETKRLEKDAAAESDRRRRARDEARALAARAEYIDNWARLQASAPANLKLSFATVPWPVHPSPRSAEDLTLDAIAAFLLADSRSGSGDEKPKKQRLKEALLLWHPDRFEGRWLPLIRADGPAETDDSERERVRAAVGVVARHLNQLMESLREP